jgi:hypothetical protein
LLQKGNKHTNTDVYIDSTGMSLGVADSGPTHSASAFDTTATIPIEALPLIEAAARKLVKKNQRFQR